MSRNVDERLVEMQFNNRQFESGVKTSIQSVEALKKGLNLDASANSLANLDKVGKSFSLAGIAAGIETLSNRFSTLGIMGITALQNITNSAINAGKNIISALTIDPIKTGLEEYETKMGAITTILTNTKSKGTTLDDVNKSLGELNEYADKTIYNFAEMTKNIGTFTAAGVDLKTSTISIKGIANLAAGSGSSAMQASSAMYQLSQALASGAVKLMDWNSVVNAGMGGELFQKALEKTAVELGHGRNMAVSFRESLESGWITTEVLTKTLEKFANDESLIKAATQVTTFTKLMETMKESVQSGWAQSWENIIGDKEQSAQFFTSINDGFGSLIGPATEARNEMLKFWNANGGRDALIQGLINVFQALRAILRPIGEAFREVFPAMTGERLVELTKKFRDFTEKLKIGAETTTRIKDIFKGLFSTLKIVNQIMVTVIQMFMSLGTVALPIGKKVLDLASSFGKFLTSLNESIKATGIFNNILKKFHDLLVPIPNIFKGFDKVSSIFSKLAITIGRVFDIIQTKVSGVLKNINFNNIFGVLDAGLFAAILFGIKKFIGTLTDIVENGSGFLENLTGILDDVRGCFEAYQTNLKARTLLAIASAIGLLAVSILVLSTIDPEKIGSSLTAITMLFGELIGVMAIFEKLVFGPGFKAMVTIPVMLISLSTAILILSVAMTRLSKIDWIGIAKGLGSIGVLMAELALFMNKTSFNSMTVKSALGILVLATALLVLASAVKKFGDIDTGVMIKGLSGVGIVLVELGIFLNRLGNPARVISIATGLTILSVAMLILAKVFTDMGQLSWEEISKGIVAMGGALLIMALTLNKMPAMSLINSLAIIDVATSLAIIGKTLKNIAQMGWDEIIKSLTTMGVAFRIIAVMLLSMKGHTVDATALTIVSVAIMSLAVALKILGGMSLTEIGVALLALAGTFTVIGLTAFVLDSLIPAIYALGVAFALFGVSIAAIGGGVLALSAGLAALAVSGVAGATALVAIISSLVSLIPFMLQKFGEGIIAMAKVIGDNAPTVIEAIMKLIMALLDTIVTNLPKIVEKGVTLVVALTNGIATMLPTIIQAAFNLILAFVNGLADAIRKNTDPMIAAIKNLMSSIIEGGKKVLSAAVPEFVTAGTAIVDGFIEGIKSKIWETAKWAANLAKSALDAAKKALDSSSPSKKFAELGMYCAIGMANGLNKYSDRAIVASTSVGTSVVESLQKTVSNISDIINGDLDGSPTIRPVVDLTNVKMGVNSINSLFKQKQGITVSTTATKASSMSDEINNSKIISSSKSNTKKTANTDDSPLTIQNTYIVRNDSDIQKINQGLDNVITRHRKAKGVPVYP